MCGIEVVIMGLWWWERGVRVVLWFLWWRFLFAWWLLLWLLFTGRTFMLVDCAFFVKCRQKRTGCACRHRRPCGRAMLVIAMLLMMMQLMGLMVLLIGAQQCTRRQRLARDIAWRIYCCRNVAIAVCKRPVCGGTGVSTGVSSCSAGSCAASRCGVLMVERCRHCRWYCIGVLGAFARWYRERFVTRVWPNELQAILCAQFRYGFFQ